jgi:hypothetical protein
MSELKTNQIATNDGNNVAIDNSLNLKSYTTTQRDALTSAAGDVIYNSTLGNPQVYDGSSWNDLKAGMEAFDITYLVVSGGGAGGNNESGDHFGTGGGGGGALNSTMPVKKSTSLTVTVGAGGTANIIGNIATNSQFSTIKPGAGTGHTRTSREGGSNGYFKGGDFTTKSYNSSGGGAGAAQNGGSTGNGYDGGNGLISTIITTTQASTYSVGEVDGSDVYYGGGGGGPYDNGSSTVAGAAGKGGGGISGTGGTAATVNTGGGGGNGSAGGSGVVILKWATADATIGATRTGLTDSGVQTDGSNSYIVFTQGTGNITFS